MRRCQSKIESMKPVDTDATTTMKKNGKQSKTFPPHTPKQTKKKKQYHKQAERENKI